MIKMIFGFRAESSLVLDYFLKDFVDPPGTVARIASMWSYGNIKVYRMDDIVLFHTNGLLEFIGIRTSVMLLITYMVALILHYSNIVYFVLPFMFLCLFFYMPGYHVRLTINKLRKYGYHENIKILNYFESKTRFDYVTSGNFRSTES